MNKYHYMAPDAKEKIDMVISEKENWLKEIEVIREKFYEGQKVRVAKNENLGSDGKRIKGRFLEEGLVVKECLKDSYLVKINGKIVKKRHCDLKNFKCLSETTRLVRGMSGVNPQ